MVSKSEQNKNKNIAFQKKEGKRKKPLKLPIGGWTFISLFLVCFKQVGENLKLVKAVSDNYMCWFSFLLSKRTEGHYLRIIWKKIYILRIVCWPNTLNPKYDHMCGLNPIVMCFNLLLLLKSKKVGLMNKTSN